VFLLGGLVKDRARYLQLTKSSQPELVSVKLSELEERVSTNFPSTRVISQTWLQAKEHDIYDITAFLRSKVFSNNGYKVKDNAIEKRFVVSA
jgi:DNA replication licensing factor MCM2